MQGRGPEAAPLPTRRLPAARHASRSPPSTAPHADPSRPARGLAATSPAAPPPAEQHPSRHPSGHHPAPVLKRDTVTTPPSKGLTSRESSGCRATTAIDAASTASRALCGIPACPPTPRMTTEKRSAAAKVAPDCTAASRHRQGRGMRGQATAARLGSSERAVPPYVGAEAWQAFPGQEPKAAGQAVCSSHLGVHGARGGCRVDVHAKGGGRTLQRAICDHERRAAAALLRGLEQQAHRAAQLAFHRLERLGGCKGADRAGRRGGQRAGFSCLPAGTAPPSAACCGLLTVGRESHHGPPVSSMAVWPSWPQACMTPGLRLLYGRPLASWTGSASMSPRSTTTGWPAPTSATMPVRATGWR